MDLKKLLPLLRIPDINWVNLQYGDVTDEIKTLNQQFGTNIINYDEVNPLKEIERQFALISNLDLIIQIDNTSIHMAGSQGVKTWMLIDEPGDFRWFPNGLNDQSCWYQNVRIIRKEQNQSWESLVDMLVPQLLSLLK